jgi:ATP adenylyltransferase/5',5'''-P-1,P-4-tetraphosphate phosphorylase II
MDKLFDLTAKYNKTASQLIEAFIESQINSWPLARDNYNGLSLVEEKVFQYDGFQIKAQFNPKRIKSSAAKVDKQSIAERKCFLCNENRPVEQQAIAFDDHFLILVNPYPIFKAHLTISSNSHTDQRFFPHIKSMLLLAKAMEGFTVFYNGPQAGASAPDHLHFQAGEKGFMLVDDEFQLLKKHSGTMLISGQNTEVWCFNNYLRKMISVETRSMDEAIDLLEAYYNSFKQLQPANIEPMMNVLCSWSEEVWTIHLFPRKTHRPSQYFAHGKEQLMISPGAVDMGGVFIIPRREDFDKITKKEITDILEQVSLDEENFKILVEELKTEGLKIIL